VQHLTIERVEVSQRHVDALVRVQPEAMRTSSSPGFSERARELLPGLVRHSCENEEHKDFMRELADTETAHALEHIAAEVMAMAGSPRSLKGETSWDFAKDGRGVFRVRLEFDDDLVAIGALRGAADAVEWLLDPSGASKPDMDATARRLADLRGTGR